MIEILAWALVIVFIAIGCVWLALSAYNANTERKHLAKITQIVDMTVAIEELRYKAALDELAKDGERDADA